MTITWIIWYTDTGNFFFVEKNRSCPSFLELIQATKYKSTAIKLYYKDKQQQPKSPFLYGAYDHVGESIGNSIIFPSALPEEGGEAVARLAKWK